jgi:hypothetical protein
VRDADLGLSSPSVSAQVCCTPRPA